MYSVSQDYLNKVIDSSREVSWYGTITLENGTVVSFDASDIVSGSLSVESDLFSKENPGIGNTCSSEFRVSLYSDIDRYAIYNAEVRPFFRLYLTENTYEDVALGVFYVTEASRTSSVISLVCYDAMIKFDEIASVNTNGTAYEILNLACITCGVTLGTTERQLRRFPNGRSTFSSYAGDRSLGTWRQIIGYITEVIGANAKINTSGELVVIQFKNTSSVRTYSRSERYSSDIADFGVFVKKLSYADAESGAVHTIVSEEADPSGYVGYEENIGINPFIPLDSQEEYGIIAMNNVFFSINTVQTIPFEITIPVDPSLEAGDFITLTGGQVDSVLCVIDNISYKSSGLMTISGCGEDLSRTKTKIENSISAIDNSVKKNATYYYDYISAAQITIYDGGSQTVVDVGYSSTTNTHISYHGQVFATATTSEVLNGSVYTEVPCVVTASFFVDDVEQSYHPQWTFDDGVNTIDLLYFYDIAEAGGGEFRAELSCSGGSLFIDTGNSRGYIEGSDFDKYFLGIYIETEPTKLIYEIGEYFDWDGLVVKGIRNDGAEVDITSECEVVPASGDLVEEEGNLRVIVSYTDDFGRPFSTYFNVLCGTYYNFLKYCTYYEYDDHYYITGINQEAVAEDLPEEITIPETCYGKAVILA